MNTNSSRIVSPTAVIALGVLLLLLVASSIPLSKQAQASTDGWYGGHIAGP